MYAMAALPVLQSLENVGIVEFRKRLEFDREFRFLLVPRLFGTVATIALAVALRSYWALVAGSLVRAVASVAMSYWMHPFRPRLALARVPDIFRFSRWMLLQNLTSGLVERIPGLVIGRAFDASSLAFYNMAREISNLATTEVRAPIRRVLYPGLSQVANHRERMASILVESTAMLALLTLPMPLGIALVAADIVPLFLGNQWGVTVALLQPLALAAAINAISTNSSLAYMATNRSYLTALAGGARLLLVIALLAALTPRFGLAGVAYAAAIASALVVSVEYALSSRLLGIPHWRFVAAVWRPVAASAAMCAAVVLLRNSVAGRGHDRRPPGFARMLEHRRRGRVCRHDIRALDVRRAARRCRAALARVVPATAPATPQCVTPPSCDRSRSSATTPGCAPASWRCCATSPPATTACAMHIFAGSTRRIRSSPRRSRSWRCTRNAWSACAVFRARAGACPVTTNRNSCSAHATSWSIPRIEDSGCINGSWTSR